MFIDPVDPGKANDCRCLCRLMTWLMGVVQREKQVGSGVGKLETLSLRGLE